MKAKRHPELKVVTGGLILNSAALPFQAVFFVLAASGTFWAGTLLQKSYVQEIELNTSKTGAPHGIIHKQKEGKCALF